jgi:hypothetical protein
MNKFKNLKENLQKDYIKIFLVFLFFLICMILIYFPINSVVSTDDPFFHIRFAEIIRNKGFNAFTDFHWLYFSKISQEQSYFIYYNFLFYLAVIPFTLIKPLFLGLKLYGVIFSSLSLTLIYGFLLKIKEKKAFFWIIFIFAILNSSSIWRLLVMRPFTIAPALLIIELYFLYKNKFWHIFFLSIFYFYWHTATFFFIPSIAVVYFLFENFYDNRFNWKIILSSFSGIIISLIISFLFMPGLWTYMKDIIFSVFYDVAIGKKINLAEGSELYPVDFFNFIRANSILFSLLIFAIVFEIFIYIKRKKVDIFKNDIIFTSKKNYLRSTLFFLSILFFLGTFFSGRNADFFVIFSIIYIVLSLNLFFENVSFKNNLTKKSLTVGIIVAMAYLFISNGLILYEQTDKEKPFDAIEGTAEWLKNNTNKNEVIFNASWNWFPTLFYYNSNNYYVAGIEPRFLYDYNASLYWKWWNISTSGYLCNKEKCDELNQEMKYFLKKDERKKIWYEKEGKLIADSIRSDFKSRFIITSKDFKNLNNIVDNSIYFEKVYTDNIYNQFFVYKIKD